MELRVFRPNQPAQPSAPTSDEGPTVQDIIDWHWTRTTTSKSKVAQKERRRLLKLFCDRYGSVPVARLTGDDLMAFLEKAKAQWTRKRWAATVQRPFNLADKLRKIQNPFRGLSFAAGDRGRDLTNAELRSLLRLATPYFRRVLIFLRISGARPGELRELGWDHIRLEVQAIIQRQHKTVATQKEPRPRRIGINSVMLKLLRWLKRRSSGSNYVFTNSRGGQWQIRALCKNLATLRTKAGLPKDVKLYGCRHAFGTGAILCGVDIATLAELMGHTSTKTTEWYLHLAGKADHLNAAMEKAGKI